MLVLSKEALSANSKEVRKYIQGKNITNVIISDGVTSIGWGAFLGCESLTSVVIPESVTSIGGSAFYDCTSLTSVAIPYGVTCIGDSAFRGCKSLTSVIIPESVKDIRMWAFDTSHLTIKGKRGSYAETYASKNNIPFRAI